jgi:cell division inhibitor SepF
MGFADVWNRTLVYFGIAEEDDDWDEDGYLTEEDLERTYSERPNVRRLTPRGRQQDFDDWTDPDPEESAPRTAVLRPRGSSRRAASASSPGPYDGAAPMQAVPSVQVHLVVPRSFNDAQQIADKFKDGIPVILNLQGADQELSKRLIDFTSGLTYALDGGMQRVADKVFLLTPRNVQVSAEERARLLERGFFNQA